MLWNVICGVLRSQTEIFGALTEGARRATEVSAPKRCGPDRGLSAKTSKLNTIYSIDGYVR